MKFAGFIMTYERASILEETLEKIFSQTVAPEKILIIDNSLGNETEQLIINLNNPKVKYYRVGYNSGPAGAAGIGLRILASEGYEWIYWGDDDDPPFFDDTFEILINTALTDTKCGCVGSVGQFFNKNTGFINRVHDDLFKTHTILSVDNIAGGMSKIVSGKMIRETLIYPDENLFYGFEELDFDLRIKNAGYTLLVDSSFFLKHRLKFNRVGLSKKTYRKKTKATLSKEYFSTRNLLYIYSKNKLKRAFVSFLLYAIFKQFLRFRDGVSIGLAGFKITAIAIYHFSTNQMGNKKIKV